MTMRNPLSNPAPKPTTLPPGHPDFWSDNARFWREVEVFWRRQSRIWLIITGLWGVVLVLLVLSAVLGSDGG
jgi:polyferredoxin